MKSSSASQTRFALFSMLLFTSSALPSYAQGTAADYQRSAKLSQNWGNKVFRSNVAPHWLPNNDAFWYRIDTAPGHYEFVFVDATKGTRQPAFDHRKLATALAEQLKREVDPQALPFNWIQLASDTAWVRFRVGKQVYEFSRAGKLSYSDQPLNEEKLAPLDRVRPSRSGGDATTLTFVNQTKNPLKLSWIDTDGIAVDYGTVAPDAFDTRNTYVGHVWQLRDGNDKPLGTYQATSDSAQVVIGEGAANVPAPRQQPQREARPEPQTTGFIRDFNIWTRDAMGQEKQLTNDGTAENYYDEPVEVSPDGTHLVAPQVKAGQEHKVYMVESSPTDQLQPKLHTIDYLKAGDRIDQPRPRLFDLATRKEIPTSDALFTNPWSIDELGWSEDGTKFRFLFNQRGHQNLRVIQMGLDGSVTTPIEEHSDTFIDYSQKTYYHALPQTDEMIWASERDGWNHLYLYSLKTGKLENQITQGEWVMREVVRVDDEKRQIWFRGFGMVPGQDPYYSQLARVNFDGSGLKILTEGDGNHRWRFSPDNRFLVDSYSRVDLAPVTTLRDADSGQKICDLETADSHPLSASGWSTPERFEAVGRDGKTPIYGIIIKPSNLDPARKYPVIEQIYAGPQDFFVPKDFGTLSGQHELAELGFVVVQIDGMGTNWRSKAFHDVCWKNLKDAGFPDRIAWMQSAAKDRPWMDLSRVGIYGVSAGAQSAMAALLFQGDFYKSAIADSGCHDNRMDKIWWNEAWMGWPVGPEYADNSNVVHAANLRGDLMLMEGELDTNVDPASTMQVVNALIKAGKDFDLVVVPGGGHGAGSGPWGTKKQRDFFVRHLLGVEPPERNASP